MPQKPKIKAIQEIAKTRLFTAESVELLFSNGENRIYERLLIKPRPAVMVIPMTKNNTLLLIKEYCVGMDRYEIVFPKGLVEDGETLKQGANRELMEEIGFGAKQITFLKQLSAAPGFINATMDIFIAEDLYPKKLPGDEPEPLDIVEWPIDELVTLINHAAFTEARSVAALFLAKQYITNREHYV